MITLSRRGLIAGFASLLAAPAIVRATSIMPVKAWTPDYGWVEVSLQELEEMGEFGLGLAPLKPEGGLIAYNGYGGITSKLVQMRAGEPVGAHDFVAVRKGLVYRATPSDQIAGMSLTAAGPREFEPAPIIRTWVSETTEPQLEDRA